MPNRILRDGILTSESVNALSWAEEVFYRRLMSVVDDFGRYYASTKLLRAACYPLHIDKVSDSDIGKWLTACVNAALVRVYPAQDGKSYLELLNFKQQVRAKDSKFPQMPSTCVADAQQPLADAHLVVVVDVSVDEGEKPARKRAAPSLKTKLPEDFGISERVKAWAVEKGHTRLSLHLESFRSKCIAKGYAYIDWDEAFMGAIRDDWAKVKGSPFAPAAVVGITVQSDAAARTAAALQADARKPSTLPTPEQRAAMEAARNSVKRITA